jgi:hypothetical protein
MHDASFGRARCTTPGSGARDARRQLRARAMHDASLRARAMHDASALPAQQL